MTGPGIFLPSSASHPAQNTPQADQTPAKKGIWVTDKGVFMQDGRAFDMMGLVFKLQGETGKIAQDRLSYTAKEIWSANRYSEKLVFYLNDIRSVRPGGKPDDEADRQALGRISEHWADTWTHVPEEVLGLGDLIPSDYWHMKQYQIDQLIEGIRSKISEVNGNQHLMQTDTERYSHMADETTEAMAAIEKALFATMQVEASKQ